MFQSTASVAAGHTTHDIRAASPLSKRTHQAKKNLGSAKPRLDGMKFFSRTSFEHLLFGLHPNVYREVDRQLQELDERYPGRLADLCKVYDLNFANATTEGAIAPDSAGATNCPAFDVHIKIDTDRIRRAHKCDNWAVKLFYQPTTLGEQRRNSNHLILGITSQKVYQNFIVPLPLVLRKFEDQVSKLGTYQVYQHTLLRKQTDTPYKRTTNSFENYIKDAGEYVGLTSRTWQKRSMEHQNAANRGSMLLFHRALRGELFKVFAHEHIVIRAGLNRAQALRVEEVEVERRTLRDLYPTGLNMIPGGLAGMRFLAKMTKRSVSSIEVDAMDDLLESAINQSLRQPGLKVKGAQTNAKLSALWKEDIEFRIKAMTNQQCRLSHQQIRAARIWSASGWALEKIHEHVNGMGGRRASIDQVKRLLDGIIYWTIPHVLF